MVESIKPVEFAMIHDGSSIAYGRHALSLENLSMPAQLRRQSYGKHRVRISKIKRPRQKPANAEHHEFLEVAVDIELDGDFAASYTAHDNSLVVATDTCRNTAYVLAKDDAMDSIESYGVLLAEHFLLQYAHVALSTIRLSERRWHRMLGSPHAFLGTDRETPTAMVRAERGQSTRVEAGIEQLLIAKTTESGFSHFHRDEFRTLPDTTDRILATELKAHWSYRDRPSDFQQARESIRHALLATFIDHYSVSVQDTLFRMGSAAIDAESSLESITLTMPNKHHLRFNLEPFHRGKR